MDRTTCVLTNSVFVDPFLKFRPAQAQAGPGPKPSLGPSLARAQAGPAGPSRAQAGLGPSQARAQAGPGVFSDWSGAFFLFTDWSWAVFFVYRLVGGEKITFLSSGMPAGAFLYLKNCIYEQ